MKLLSVRSGLAVLLCCALLCACGLPVCRAAEQSAEEVILFTQMDEDTGLYVRMDETVCGVSETLRAAFIPKNDLRTVPQIDSGSIRTLPPCAENGGRLELFLPVTWTPGNAVLRISGLLDGAGTAIEREITFSRGSYAIDAVRIKITVLAWHKLLILIQCNPPRFQRPHESARIRTSPHECKIRPTQ